MDDCIFCKFVNGDLPCHKVWEDDNHLAFLTIFPNTKGVTVVITKAHNPSYIFENGDDVISGIMLASKKVANILTDYFGDAGRCGIIFEGFGVNHFHSKIYPMHGTGNMEDWKQIESETNKKYFDLYPGYLSSNDSERASDEDLSKLAEELKNLSK